jgi:glycosyltransferase
MNVCLIVFNSETDKFSIIHEDGVQKILFPPMPGYYFDKYKMINILFRLHINDSSENLFIVNHSPCELFLESLKKSFPKSKTAFVIHDMGWTFRFLGDSRKFKEMIQTINLENTNKEYKAMIDYFLEEQRIFKLVDKVIVLARETESLLKEIYAVDEKKIFYAINGLRDSYWPRNDDNEKTILKQKLHLNKDEKIILYTGRCTPVKGTYQLLNCFEKVLRQYTNSRLVIVGTLFDHCKILKYASDIAAKITYTGHVTAVKVREWYRVADMGILPSYLEQCSYTGIEMMMHALPIVSSDGYCLGNMFADGKNSRIAKIESRTNSEKYETNLANAIIELLASEEVCKMLSYNAREKYISYYNISNMKDRYRILLESFD